MRYASPTDGQVGASRLEMPQLLSSSLWHKTGRVDAMGSEVRAIFSHSFFGSRIVEIQK